MKLTLSTVFNYVPDLFDNMVIPAGLDRDTLIQNIIFELGEFGVLYADGDLLKSFIGYWSKKELPIWEKLYETLNYQYNPIDNYDRTEIRDRNISGNSESKETSFDSDTLRTTNGADSTGNEHEETRTRGNIGVRSSQELIEQQRKLVEFDMYGYIIKSFSNKFLLEIY